MHPGRKKLYVLLGIMLAAGYSWLLYQVLTGHAENNDQAGVCLFHIITGIPCPSCGSTRSVAALLHGHIMKSLAINPLGVLIAAIMVCAPVWLLYDLLTGRSSLYDSFCKAEILIARPVIAVPAIGLLILNWIWNISKGL